MAPSRLFRALMEVLNITAAGVCRLENSIEFIAIESGGALAATAII